jgi:hypothetical protein
MVRTVEFRMAEFRDRMVALVANSLIDGVIGSRDEGCYPHSVTMEDLDQNYDHKALEALIQKRWGGESSVFNYTTTEIIQDAKIRALEMFPHRLAEHGASTEGPPKPTSASIFLSQLNATGGGGLLGGFVTWDMIQEQESSDEEKIDRLVKIQYVDDILEDWDTGIRPFLTQFETRQVCTLYRTWFGKARSTGTTDSYAMQRDLAAQLLDVSLSNSSSTDVSHMAIESAVEMFIDLVDRSIPDCLTMGKRLWQVVLSNPKNLVDVIVQTDPYATSFALWLSTDEMTVDQTLNLASGTSLTDADEASVDISTLLERAIAGQPAPNGHFYFILSILHSIINCTRVYKFPWDLLVERNWADVLSLFLCGVVGTVDERHVTICLDALDILDKGMVQPELRKKLLCQCQNERKRLQQYCDEMDACDRRETISSLLHRINAS